MGLTTRKMRCSCEHDYQDEKYGRKIRLHNKLSKKAMKNWRCTVCGKEK